MKHTAMRWWINLPEEEREKKFEEYKTDHFTPANTYNQLTGREIERLYVNREESPVYEFEKCFNI